MRLDELIFMAVDSGGRVSVWVGGGWFKESPFEEREASLFKNT